MSQSQSISVGRTLIARLVMASLLVVIPVAGGGCAVLGVAANKVTRTMVKPSYTRLANESVAVMVTVDRGTQIDYPRLQLDIAQAVQAKLLGAQKNKADELEGTQFPSSANPTSIFAVQRNHPEYDLEKIETIAPKVGVSRLIYVEVETFSLNPADVLELFRGEVSGRVKVVEVTGSTGKVAFDDTASAVFPENAPPDGTPDIGRAVTYRGVVDAFAVSIVQKFVSYETTN